MSKCFLYVIYSLVCFSGCVLAQETAVYRWVDEQGNVHFADRPKSKDAQLFFVTHGNVATPVPSQQVLPIEQTETEQSAENSEEQGKSQQAEQPIDCAAIKAEAAKAREIIANANSRDAAPAIIYLAAAEKLLAKGECN